MRSLKSLAAYTVAGALGLAVLMAVLYAVGYAAEVTAQWLDAACNALLSL